MNRSLACLALLVASSHFVAGQGTAYSRPELANASVGYLDTTIRGFSYRGSATVVRDPRLIYSCAHNFYDRGVWARDYRFFRAIHQQGFPTRSQGADPRGFHYFTRYARAARFTDGESNQSFANDFVVLYGNTPFGPAAPVQERSARLLRGFQEKRIIGYPARIDFTGERGFYFQHSTGWFTQRATRIRGPFQEFFDVSTGPGNSGGGIFLRDPATGTERFAGVLVSGGRRTAGVVSMNRASQRLADRALGSATQGFLIHNSNRITLDATRPSTIRTLPVSTLDGDLETASLEVDATGSPRIWLESPDGRVARVPSNGRLPESFGGTRAGGTWRLHVHNPPGSTSRFRKATLRGTAHRTHEE